MKTIHEHHRLCAARIERSRYAVFVVIVAIAAFLFGMFYGSGTETTGHDSRIEWPKLNAVPGGLCRPQRAVSILSTHG